MSLILEVDNKRICYIKMFLTLILGYRLSKGYKCPAGMVPLRDNATQELEIWKKYILIDKSIHKTEAKEIIEPDKQAMLY